VQVDTIVGQYERMGLADQGSSVGRREIDVDIARKLIDLIQRRQPGSSVAREQRGLEGLGLAVALDQYHDVREPLVDVEVGLVQIVERRIDDHSNIIGALGAKERLLQPLERARLVRHARLSVLRETTQTQKLCLTRETRHHEGLGLGGLGSVLVAEVARGAAGADAHRGRERPGRWRARYRYVHCGRRCRAGSVGDEMGGPMGGSFVCVEEMMEHTVAWPRL